MQEVLIGFVNLQNNNRYPARDGPAGNVSAHPWAEGIFPHLIYPEQLPPTQKKIGRAHVWVITEALPNLT
jgi:hypothetical protein